MGLSAVTGDTDLAKDAADLYSSSFEKELWSSKQRTYFKQLTGQYDLVAFKPCLANAEQHAKSYLDSFLKSN